MLKNLFLFFRLKTLNSGGKKRAFSVFPLRRLTKFGAKLGRVFLSLLFCVDIQTIQKSARKDRERERERESGERESVSQVKRKKNKRSLYNKACVCVCVFYIVYKRERHFLPFSEQRRKVLSSSHQRHHVCAEKHREQRYGCGVVGVLENQRKKEQQRYQMQKTRTTLEKTVSSQY